jgi:DtxR family Mn-dependent transcriptional regulator
MSALLIGLLVGVVVALGVVGLFWPGWGIVPRWRRATRSAERVRIEDTLKHLYVSEVTGVVPNIQSVAGVARLTADEAAEVLQGLQSRRLIALEPDGIRLTAPGRELGLNVLRAHRLWERYLADQTGYPEIEWHGRAEAYEHRLSPAQTDTLSARLGHPTHDPHGDPIPTAEGELPRQAGVPLTAASLDEPLRIVHIEDEPEVVYAQLVAEGLHPGMQVRVTEISPQRVCLWADGDEHVLAPMVAANLSVVSLPRAVRVEERVGEPLSSLKPGEEGKVLLLSRRCRGQERRRLLDLGVLPGTVIRAEMRSPNGDPTAYRIRDALIALRAEQAEVIRVQRLPQPTAAAT